MWYNKAVLRKAALVLFLLLITCIGASIRVINTSPFLFYPDAYQNLIVAQNILHFHSVLGRLGTEGMVYPDFIAWTRPGYAFLIAGVLLFVHNKLLVAQTIANVFSIATIPLAYFFIKHVFNSKRIGLIASCLIAFSFTHIVWTGFIQTEAVSVFLVMLLFTLFFHKISSQYTFGNGKDLITGIVLGFAVLTRYEYMLLIIPLGYLLWKNSPSIYQRSVTIFSSFLFFCAVIVTLFFPMQIIITGVYQQTGPLATKLLVLGSICIILIILLKKLSLQHIFKHIQKRIIAATILVGGAIYVVLPIFFPWTNIASGFRNFLLHDFFLNIISLIGIYLLLQRERKLLIFVAMGMLFLGGAYMGINPSIERYATHLLPFFLIPASYGLYHLLKFVLCNRSYIKKILLSIVIILLGSVQVYLSFFGIRKWGNGEWFKTSYEEESAKKIASVYKEDDSILLASFPEPYYFFSDISTYSLTDIYPYIYISPNISKKTVIIIKDRGMTYLFPHFVTQILGKLEKYKRISYGVDRPFHYANITEKQTQRVVVYVLPISVFRQTITISHSNTNTENTR